MNKRLGGTVLPEAVLAGEVFARLGEIQARRGGGLRIPADIAIIGFANEAFGEYLTPSLSTVNQQTVVMGEEAAKLMFGYLRGGMASDMPPRKLVLKPQLICRESSVKFL